VNFYQPHPTRGWTLKPSTEGRHQELDFSIEVKINSQGLRDPERAIAKPPGVFRILLVSDSGTFASGSTREQSPPGLLEKKLGPGVEVMNFAVPAYSTVQQYLMLKEEGLRWQPDLVLLAFAQNDLLTNYEPIQKLFQRSARRPYARLDAANGTLVIDTEKAAAAAKVYASTRTSLWNRFVLVRVVRVSVGRLFQRRKPDPNIFLGRPFLKSFLVSQKAKRSEADYNRLWDDSWAVSEALVLAMRRDSEAAGARFAAYVQPVRFQGSSAMRASLEAAFPGLQIDEKRLNREFAEFGARNGFPVLDALSAVQAADAGGKGPLFYVIEDEHFTPMGHEIMVDALVRQLRERQLVPQP
jgi:hypothetical protein